MSIASNEFVVHPRFEDDRRTVEITLVLSIEAVMTDKKLAYIDIAKNDAKGRAFSAGSNENAPPRTIGQVGDDGDACEGAILAAEAFTGNCWAEPEIAGLCSALSQLTIVFAGRHGHVRPIEQGEEVDHARFVTRVGVYTDRELAKGLFRSDWPTGYFGGPFAAH